MDAALPNLPLEEGQVLATADLIGSGHTRASILTSERAGTLNRLRSGYFWVPPPGQAREDPAIRHRALIVAAAQDAARRGRDIVLAGPSAAIWLGLPWIGPPPTLITTAGAVSSHAGRRAHLRPIGEVPGDQVARHDGISVTSAARTVLETARLSPARTGLVVADAALQLQLTTAAELASLLPLAAGRRAAARVRWVFAHADGRSESPGESISRYAFIRAGLPMPNLQEVFELPSGGIAKVDFAWRAPGPLGEFDGLVKYRADPQGRTASEVVIAEKRREDELRALGRQVVRWCWAEAWNPGQLITRLRALVG